MKEEEILKRLADYCSRRVKPTLEDLSRCVGCHAGIAASASNAFTVKVCGDCWQRISAALNQASKGDE
jgi:hypothetical protein